MKRVRRKYVFATMAAVLSTGLALLIAEVSIRIFVGKDNKYYSEYFSRPLLFGGKYGVELAKGFQGQLHYYHIYEQGSPLRPWTVTINQHGWRDPHVNLSKAHTPPGTRGTKLFLVLGDSVTYGPGVNDNQLYAAAIAHALALGPDTQWKVLNRSVPGWSASNQLAFLQARGAILKPDVVTVVVVSNDMLPLTSRFQPSGFPWYKGIVSRSALLTYLRTLMLKFGVIGNPAIRGVEPLDTLPPMFPIYRYALAPEKVGSLGGDPWWDIRVEYNSAEKEQAFKRAMEASKPLYLQIAEVCKDLGADCLFVLSPHAYEVSKRYWVRLIVDDPVLRARWINELTAWFEQQDLAYLNLLNRFRDEAETSSDALYLDGAHWSTRGHQVAAEEVIKYMVERDVLKIHARPFWE